MTGSPGVDQDRPRTLYRLYAGDGALLYIGISHRPGGRMSDHESGSAWWADVRSVTFETFPCLSTARKAERQAVRAENPLHNACRFAGP